MLAILTLASGQQCDMHPKSQASVKPGGKTAILLGPSVAECCGNCSASDMCDWFNWHPYVHVHWTPPTTEWHPNHPSTVPPDQSVLPPLPSGRTQPSNRGTNHPMWGNYSIPSLDIRTRTVAYRGASSSRVSTPLSTHPATLPSRLDGSPLARPLASAPSTARSPESVWLESVSAMDGPTANGATFSTSSPPKRK